MNKCSVYRAGGVYEFNLVRCDRIVASVLAKVKQHVNPGPCG